VAHITVNITLRSIALSGDTATGRSWIHLPVQKSEDGEIETAYCGIKLRHFIVHNLSQVTQFDLNLVAVGHKWQEKCTVSKFTAQECGISDSGVPRNFVPVGEGGSKNSVEDRGQRQRGSEDGIPPSQGFWRQL